MNADATRRVVAVIEGNWNKLADVRAAALADWLGRTPASEAAVLEAVAALVEKSPRYAPKPGELIEELKIAGALGQAALGSGDPRVLARMTEDIRDSANALVESRRIGYRAALDLLAATYRDYLRDAHTMWPDPADGHDDKGYWADRLAACDALISGLPASREVSS